MLTLLLDEYNVDSPARAFITPSTSICARLACAGHSFFRRCIKDISFLRRRKLNTAWTENS